MDQFILKVPNQALYNFAIVYAKEKNVPVFSETYRDRKTDFESYPCLKYDGEHVVGSRSTSQLPVINIEQFIEWCDNYQKSTLQLNESYTAQIFYKDEVVKVGCQSISFKKVEELYKLVKAGASK